MLSHLVVAALLASVINAEGKCMPDQFQVDILGKVAQDNQGQAIVFELAGVFAADYKANKEVIIEFVFSEGKLLGNYLYLRTSVSY